MYKAITLALFLLTICMGSLQAQGTQSCGPTHPPGTLRCTQSCIYCDFIGVEDTTNAFLPAPQSDFCTIYENSRWYGFIAGSTTIGFDIVPTFCNGGQGLQAALYQDCNLIKVCNTGGFGVATLGVFATGLTVGASYQLVVDGLNGDVCGFRINLVQGSVTPPPLGAIGLIEGPAQVCPNGTATYSIPAVANAVGYTWTAPLGAKINGGGNTITLPAATGTSVDIFFPNTTAGAICVTASNACSTPVQSCLTVTNQPLPITQLPEEIACYESIPYEWAEEPHTLLFAPGSYNLISTPYESILGCDSFVRQKITLLPKIVKNLGVQYLCNGACIDVGFGNYCEAGTYQEVISAENGCDSTINFIIVELHAVAFAQVSDTITCDTPAVMLTSVGSTPTGTGISYAWYNPGGAFFSGAPSVSVSAPGNYRLVVTHLQGGATCRDTAEVTVVAETTFPNVNPGPPQVLNCTQTIVQLHGTGSVGPDFTYLWVATNGGNIVSGANTLTPLVNEPGTYTLYVTNISNGCVAHLPTYVTQTIAPPELSVSGGTFNCLQTTVTLQATTDAVNPTFAWTGPNGFISSLQNPTVSAGGNYVLAVTDGVTGCTTTATAVVVANNQTPGATATGGIINCETSSVTLDGGSPTGGVSFSWTGPNGFTSSEEDPTVSAAGSYTIVVTAANGCTSTATAVVMLDNAIPGAALATSGNLNCNNASVNLIATANTTAPLDYTWLSPDGSSTSTGTVATFNVNQPGLYSVVVTNTTNGCTSTASFTVIQHQNVVATIASQTDVSCFGANNGAAVVGVGGGDGNFTYDWNTGDTTATITGLGGGVFIATVTDGEGCSASVSITIAEPSQLIANASATPQTSNGAADGTVTAIPSGGTPPYTYAWETGDTTQTVNGLMPDSYSVTITDANGCTSVETVTVNAYNCVISASVQATNVSCNGSANGSATVAIVGGTAPFAFDWSVGSSADTITGLAPGAYTVSILDAANCPLELNFSISQPNVLAANATATGTSGPLTNNGTASASPSGGTAPYTYAWSTGDSTASIDSLAGGFYTVSITDANGCTATQEVEVTVGNCGLLTSFVSVNPACNGAATGSATIVVTGGTSPFTFVWSSGDSTATASNLLAGTYAISVIDPNGCAVTDNVTLTDPPLLTITVDSLIATSCVNAPEGSATVAAQGGTGAVSFEWSDLQTGPTAIDLVADTYTVTATDANGCTATMDITIEAIDTEGPTIDADSVSVALGQSGSVTLNLQNLGAHVTDNCQLSSINIGPNVFDCGDLGDHQVVIIAEDDAGNVSTDTFTVTIVDDLVPVMSCPQSIIRCFTDDHVVNYNAPTATDNCFGNGGNFEFVSGLLSGATFPVGTTTNTYTYTDAQGNVGSCSFEVTILSEYTLTVDNVKDDVGDQSIGAISISVSGSLPPYTYEWQKDGVAIPDSTEDLSGLGEGVYTVIVTDAVGCTVASDTIVVHGLVGTEEPGWANGLGIRPNPTTGRLFISLPDAAVLSDVQVRVFDLMGRPVAMQTDRQSKQIVLDLSEMPSGMYTLLLQLEGRNVVRKVVVSK